MSCNRCSENFSSKSSGGYLQYAVSCGSSRPSNVFYCTDLQTPITHQLDCPLQGCCQETWEPTSFQTSCVASSRCHRPWHRPCVSATCSPCQAAFSGSLGFGSRGFQSFGCGFPSLGYGSHRFHSVGCGPHTFSSVNCRPNFYRPAYFSTKSCQSVSYQPSCGSGFF